MSFALWRRRHGPLVRIDNENASDGVTPRGRVASERMGDRGGRQSLRLQIACQGIEDRSGDASRDRAETSSRATRRASLGAILERGRYNESQQALVRGFRHVIREPIARQADAKRPVPGTDSLSKDKLIPRTSARMKGARSAFAPIDSSSSPRRSGWRATGGRRNAAPDLRRPWRRRPPRQQGGESRMGTAIPRLSG